MGKKRPEWATNYLNEFIASGEDFRECDASMTSGQRAVLHWMCRELGLKSKSIGIGGLRHLTISKRGPNEPPKVKKPKLPVEQASGVKKKVAIEGTPSVKKVKKKKLPPAEELNRVSLPQEAQPVLRELFTRYPPSENDATESALSVFTGHLKSRSRWKDDFFCRPRMKKEEIVDKLACLSSRLKTDKGFREIYGARSKLPIASFREAITSAVDSNQVVLIAGETGCGKTTQVPQYLLDNMWYNKREACKIICTQPRRISAISVSERISWERGETIGNNIGYKVRLQSEGGRQSSIVFCTNGVMLRVLVGKGVGSRLTDITHIIVDEIHERDCYSDFMLAILRDLLPSNPHLRLILMSATLDAERFSGYFGGCPVVRVPGFTYPVKTFYLEDVLSVVKSDEKDNRFSPNSSIPDEKRDLSDEDKVALDEAIDLAWTNDEFDDLLDLVSSAGNHGIYNYRQSSTWLTPLMVFAGKGRVSDVCKLLSFGADFKLKSKEGITAAELAEKENQFEAAQIIKGHADKVQSISQKGQDLLDKYMAEGNSEDVDVGLIVQLMQKICFSSEEGAFLVFLPGWEEISKTKDKLLSTPFFEDSMKFDIICLHSRIPADEQKRVFDRPSRGCRKIVLATNIAESAVTIDDVVYVIDSGRMKEKSYDPYSDVATLQSSWVSKANAKQREGRAGRCQPGICYHLYSKLRAASLPEFGVPEVRRMPVDELCLQVKILEPSCNIYEFLQKLMDPPLTQSITNALTTLKNIGALTPHEELTELGHKFGQLPVHPRISKMLYFAILVNCLDPALILACAADSKDPFVMPITPGDKKKAIASKRKFASLYGGYSDHLATVAAFQCWKIAKRNGQSNSFCSQFFVSFKSMRMLDNMREKLRGELKRHRLIPSSESDCSLNAHDPGILRAVVAVGFYPMVGTICPPSKYGWKSLVEVITGAQVKVRSLNTSKMSSGKQDESLIVFDEITRGDWDVYIRNYTVLPTLLLLLFCGEIAVAPSGSLDAKKNNDMEDHKVENVGDVMDTDEAGGSPGDKVMLSPENLVKVVVDQWLPFEIKAFEVAQMYILRDRLMASILFKIKHPEENLPAHLGASMYAIACMLSYNGQSSSPVEPISSSAKLQTEPKSANILDLVNTKSDIPADLANGNDQTEPETTPMEAASAAKQPEKKRSKSKRRKLADSLDLKNTDENMPSDLPNGNEQTELNSAKKSDMVNIEESLPSNLANGNEQTEPLMEAASAAKQPEKKRSKSKKRKLADNLDLKSTDENMPSDLLNGDEPTELNSPKKSDLGNKEESLPSNLANGNEQTEPNTAPMETASAAKQPEKKRSKSKKRKLADNLDLKNTDENMPSDLLNGNEQTELNSAKKSDLGNIEESLPSNLTNGNEQTEPDTAPMDAASAAKQPEKKGSKSKRRKLANSETMPSDLPNGNEQTEFKKLDLGNIEESLPSNLANGIEQPDPNTAPAEADSAARSPQKNLDSSNNMEENMPSPKGIEQPTNSALAEAALSTINEVQTEPRSVNTTPTEAASMENI